jgi:hypothetical protein
VLQLWYRITESTLMKNPAKRALQAGLVLLAMALGGCATLNESECRAVDWKTIGYEDGTRGYSGERIAQHRKACAKYGISPDLAAYQKGRDAGLREYCRPANGFRIGAAGRSYAGICPSDLDDAFTAAHESGWHLHELRVRVSETVDRIESRRHELDSTEDELARSSAAIIASDSSAERRAQALVDTKQLAERIGRLKADIRHLEEQRVHHDIELQEYRATLQYAE